MTDDRARETAATYDRIVDDYEVRASEVAPHFAAFRNSFVSRLPAGALVLDVGCGPGRDARHYLHRGLRVVGLDASSGMAARAGLNGVPVVIGDHRRPPFRSGSADGVWSSATLLHVPGAEVPATLAAWHRLLRPGGVLGLSTSLGDSEGWEDVPYAARGYSSDVELRRWFVHLQRPQLLEMLSDAGFTLVDAQERTSHRRWLQVLAEAGRSSPGA